MGTLRHRTLRHRTLRYWTLRHTFQFRVDATAHIGMRYSNQGYISRISFIEMLSNFKCVIVHVNVLLQYILWDIENDFHVNL